MSKVIDILTQENLPELITIKHKQIRIKKVMLCEYCFMPKRQNQLMTCSSKGCTLKICSNCATYISGKPFCNDCMLDIVKNKSLIVITKGKI